MTAPAGGEGPKLADQLFEASYALTRAQVELEDEIEQLGVPHEDISWDPYDGSIELKDVPPEYRLTIEAQRFLYEAGFIKAYLNHTDKWETHYTFKLAEPFREAKGWRVSYPHKRGEPKGAIWVEAVVEGWPAEWFETGYCVVKEGAKP